MRCSLIRKLFSVYLSQDEVLPIDSIMTLVPMVLVYTVLFVILATNHLKKADVVAG